MKEDSWWVVKRYEKVSWWEVLPSLPHLDVDHQHQDEKEEVEKEDEKEDGKVSWWEVPPSLPHLDPWQYPIHIADEEELKSHFLSLLMFG